MNTKILIVDDVPENLNLLRQLLEPQGAEVLAARDSLTALEVARRTKPDLILLDVAMPGQDGFETCRHLKASISTQHIPVIFVTVKDETDDIVKGFEVGGVDYITKPFREAELLARVQTHLQVHQLKQELIQKNQALQQEIAQRQSITRERNHLSDQLTFIDKREAEQWDIDQIVGESTTLQRILQQVRRVQVTDRLNVLITGESGTGKELVARAIHHGSDRSNRRFYPVNCSSVPETLAESMFFGHVRGAFTGATTDQEGYFALADGGTLFLDEIGTMPLHLQPKLLRVLEDGLVTPVGANTEKQVNVRVLSATNEDLQNKVTEGTFRPDLYYRLVQYQIVVPPLRERKEDIPTLASHFLRLFSSEMGIAPTTLSPAALDLLQSYHFPGNIRELKTIIERSVVDSEGRAVQPKHLHLSPLPPADHDPLHVDLPMNLEQAELVLVKKALDQTDGNITAAARLLGVSRPRLYRSLRKLEQR